MELKQFYFNMTIIMSQDVPEISYSDFWKQNTTYTISLSGFSSSKTICKLRPHVLWMEITFKKDACNRARLSLQCLLIVYLRLRTRVVTNLHTICTAYLLGYLLASRLVCLGEKPSAHLHFARARWPAVWMGSGFPCLVSWAVFLRSFVLVSDSAGTLTSGRQAIQHCFLKGRGVVLRRRK